MRIYNGTNSQLNLPYAGNERLTISPKSPSGNIMCSSEFLSLLITSYTTDEVAIIVSGPFEINACANVPAAVNYVVQSLDEAIQKFAIPTPVQEEETKPAEPEPIPTTPEPIKEEVKEEEKKEEEATEEVIENEVAEDEPEAESVVSDSENTTTTKKSGKKNRKNK